MARHRLAPVVVALLFAALVIGPPYSTSATASRAPAPYAYDLSLNGAPALQSSATPATFTSRGLRAKPTAIDRAFSVPAALVVAAEAEPGAWATANESMSERAAAYQEQITGASPGSVYEVNGVKFDGYSDGYSDGVLEEAKGPGYANFVKDGEFVGWFQGEEGLVSQAESQLRAAGGTPITWSVAEPQARRQRRYRHFSLTEESLASTLSTCRRRDDFLDEDPSVCRRLLGVAPRTA